MATINRFEDLEIWQLARDICNNFFLITDRIPFNKDFSLKNQIRRSSGSIMDNISEGFEREGRKEFIQHLSISKGSAGECRSQLYRAFDRKYTTKDEFDEIHNMLILENHKIKYFINYLKKSTYNDVKYKS